MSSTHSFNGSSIVRRPTSPTRMFSSDDTSFYSLPSSPTKATWRSSYSYDLGTEPTTPATFEDAKSNLDEFEFDTSRHFFIEDRDFETILRPKNAMEHQQKVSLPAMAFADELFCDGIVMPLKPPPRFLYPNDQKSSNLGSTPVSPQSPNSLLKVPFQRRSLWNDDFDPFMVALENVKSEVHGNSSQGKNGRRARSISPSWANSYERLNNDFMGCNHVHDGDKPLEPIVLSPRKHPVEPIGPYSVWIPNLTEERPMEMLSKDIHKKPMKLVEPKGVIFARRSRMAKMDFECSQESKMETGGNSKEGTKEKKTNRIKKFLHKSSSMIKASDGYKQTDEKMELPKPRSMTKMSFKSLELTQQKYHDEKGGAEATKMTLVQYKPKLLLCMGLGNKYFE